MTKFISAVKAYLAMVLLAAPVIGLLELSSRTGGDSCLNCGGPPPACWSSEDCTWLDP